MSQPWTGFLLCCPLPAPRLDHHHLPRRRDLAVEAQKLCHLLRFMRCHCAHPAERRWSSYLCGRRCRWSTNGIERHDCRSSLPGCCTDSFYCPSFGVCNLSTTSTSQGRISGFSQCILKEGRLCGYTEKENVDALPLPYATCPLPDERS